MEGLQNDAKFQILSRKIEELDDAILVASELESCRSRNVHSVHEAQKQNFRNRDNFAVKASFTNFKNNGKLNNNRAGFSHVKVHKNHEVNKNKSGESKKAQFVHKADTTVTCFRCKKSGQCKTRTNARQEQILTAIESELDMLKINGLLNDLPVDFYFDSGATTSIISSTIVQKYSIPILPSQTQKRSANNSVDTILGITPPLTINVENHVCNLQLLIINNTTFCSVSIGFKLQRLDCIQLKKC